MIDDQDLVAGKQHLERPSQPQAIIVGLQQCRNRGHDWHRVYANPGPRWKAEPLQPRRFTTGTWGFDRVLRGWSFFPTNFAGNSADPAVVNWLASCSC